jgi:hypothetical protein
LQLCRIENAVAEISPWDLDASQVGPNELHSSSDKYCDRICRCRTPFLVQFGVLDVGMKLLFE